MTIIDRYLLRAVAAGTGLVLLVVLALGGFIRLIRELDGIGTGTYELRDAIGYVALNLPREAFEIFPVAALLGALLGLGNLASHSELIVMRISGVSRLRMASSAAGAGLVLMVVAAALGELIGPPMEQYGRQHRALSKFGELGIADLQNAWAKDGNRIFNFQQLTTRGPRGGVYVFEFDGDRALVSLGHAGSAGFDAAQRWQLDNYRETRFTESGVVARAAPRVAQQSSLNPDVLDLSVVEPDSLSTIALYNYILYLTANELDSEHYEIAFWSRIAGTVSVVLMTVLALPFVFGPLRSARTGARLIAGVLIGVAYYLTNKTLAHSGAVFGIDAIVIAWSPTLVIGVAAFYGIVRLR